MYNFFCDNLVDDCFLITDTDCNHIVNVLRMKIGDEFLVSMNNKSNLCKIVELSPEVVRAKIIEENFQDTSLSIELVLMQGLPKSDKMELIIQKAVELGVNEIIPVETSRSIVKLLGNKKDNKISRWQSIAESGAKQSKRTIIPTVSPVVSFNDALKLAKDFDLFILPYESKNGMQDTKAVLQELKPNMKVGVFIGPEGGFSQEEVEKAQLSGAKIISLGKRILRTETAAITSLSMLMLHAEMNF